MPWVAEKSLSHDGEVRLVEYRTEGIVSGGPFSEGAEVVGGVPVILAASREEAIAWARECAAEVEPVRTRR